MFAEPIGAFLPRAMPMTRESLGPSVHTVLTIAKYVALLTPTGREGANCARQRSALCHGPWL